MRLLDRARSAPVVESERDGMHDLSWLAEQYMSFSGISYPLTGMQSSGQAETLGHSFASYVSGAYQSNGIVFACIAARLLLFSEMEFKWRAVQDRKLFGTEELLLLESPAPGLTTQDMLASCEVDLSLAGNAYWTVTGTGPNRRLRRLRPDWVSIMSTGDPDSLESEVIAYAYHEGGPATGDAPKIIPAADVAHYTMIPDPTARHRGMSWITPIVDDITADSGFTKHRKKAVENSAVSPFAVMYPALGEDEFRAAVAAFRQNYEGAANSGKAIHVSGGADLKPLGSSLRELDFKSVQAGGETRIALAARVPAVVLGIAEGLGGSALNSGNYAQARRQFSDGYAHPHWRSLCGAFSTLVGNTDKSRRLWYDTRDISFLREDQKDQAEALVGNATAIRQLVDGGYEPDSVVSAVNAGDLTLLKHTGKLSVQLQEPGAVPSSNEGEQPPEGPPIESKSDDTAP